MAKFPASKTKAAAPKAADKTADKAPAKAKANGNGTDKPMKHLYLVDGSGYLFRAYHARCRRSTGQTAPRSMQCWVSRAC